MSLQQYDILECMVKLLLGDCLEKLKELEDNSIDAIVTDPPYELGFMGKKWDNTGIAYNVDMWKECLRVLKAGGHLVSFGGTRTYHRMAVAIEDAGFEIRDMIEWVYASGFPKSMNIGKMYEKKIKNKREIIGKGKPMSSLGVMHDDNWKSNNEYNETKGTSPYEGLGTALKPAHEPIVLARKPLSEKTVVDNIIKWGTGGIEIEYRSNLKDLRLESNTESVLYRVLCELINNTIKHAHAKKIKININYDIYSVCLNYSDNGKGFESDNLFKPQEKGTGLYNIYSRINSLKGKIDINSQAGSGTDVIIKIPFTNDDKE